MSDLRPEENYDPPGENSFRDFLSLFDSLASLWVMRYYLLADKTDQK